MIDFDNLGKRIRKTRRDLEITQSELAKKINIASHSTISKYEHGTSVPDLFLLNKISIVLRVSVSYLIGESDNKEIPKNKNSK